MTAQHKDGYVIENGIPLPEKKGKYICAVVDLAIEETWDSFCELWRHPDEHLDAVNFALGLFIGILSRRMDEQAVRPEKIS